MVLDATALSGAAAGPARIRAELSLAEELGVLPQFRAGAWLVELAPVRDPERVVGGFAATFGITARAGRTVTPKQPSANRRSRAIGSTLPCRRLGPRLPGRGSESSEVAASRRVCRLKNAPSEYDFLNVAKSQERAAEKARLLLQKGPRHGLIFEVEPTRG